MGYAFACLLVVMLVAGVVWWRRCCDVELRALQARCFAHPANAKSLAGLHLLLAEWKLDSAPSFEAFTAGDVRRMKRTIGQLYAPTDELFPLLRTPLPGRCLWKIDGCPVLVHPATGVIFGLRVGTYLCLLRLPEHEQALAEGAVWPRPPLPPLKDCDIAARFGTEWVVPNEASPAMRACCLAACEAAGRKA